MSSTGFPFLTSYDPPGSGEGALDPMGLYQIADQLAVQLVPGVRERMQRVRFLTAMAVGTFVTEGLEDAPQHRDADPYLVWEWLVVEALVREMRDVPGIRGVPGTLVAKTALDQHGYLDARSYLKTPRIFGFHGVYKRLAIHLKLVDVHLGPSTNAERLADAWARGLGLAGLRGAREVIERWRKALERSLGESPPRTKTGWSGESWRQLAEAFAPMNVTGLEKRCLRELLHGPEGRLGALPSIWQLQADFDDESFQEERLHELLGKREPSFKPLLTGIRAYERFARSLQDAFDVLRAEAAKSDTQGLATTDVAADADFRRSVTDLHRRYEAAHQALAGADLQTLALQSLFDQRFRGFADPLAPADAANALCVHHEAVQKAKSADGKRPWFDRLGPHRIYTRHAYRERRREITPDRYVHDYRGWPIRRFSKDLQ